MGDRRHRARPHLAPARPLLLPVVLAGAWTAIGLALGASPALADTGNPAPTPSASTPPQSVLHPQRLLPVTAPSARHVPSAGAAVARTVPRPAAVLPPEKRAEARPARGDRPASAPLPPVAPSRLVPAVHEVVAPPAAAASRTLTRTATAAASSIGEPVMLRVLPGSTTTVGGAVRRVATGASRIIHHVTESAPVGTVTAMPRPTRSGTQPLPVVALPSAAVDTGRPSGGSGVDVAVAQPPAGRAAVAALPAPGTVAAPGTVPAPGTHPLVEHPSDSASEVEQPVVREGAPTPGSRTAGGGSSAAAPVLHAPGSPVAPDAPAPAPTMPSGASSAGMGPSPRGAHTIPLVTLEDGALAAGLAPAARSGSAATEDPASPTYGFDVTPD